MATKIGFRTARIQAGMRFVIEHLDWLGTACLIAILAAYAASAIADAWIDFPRP